MLMSTIQNESILESLFDEVYEELVTPNFKQLEPQDVAVIEEIAAPIAQQRFEDMCHA